MSQRVVTSFQIAALLALLDVSGHCEAGVRTTENLVVNGNAEEQRCSDDWSAQTSVPGWRVTRGAASVLCYSAFQWTTETPSTPAGASRGRALFAAPGADTAMEQVITVGAAAAAIDRSTVRFDLSGWLGGWDDRPEHAVLTALFLDEEGTSTGPAVVIADAGAAARGYRTGLVARSAHGVVPAQTRRIRVTLQFLSAPTSFHNAYADNVSLTLSGDVDDVEAAALEPARARIPALDHVIVVMMENTNFADVFRANGAAFVVDPKMPYTAELARSGVVLANMWGTYHPSDQNYVAMLAGDTFKYGLTYFPGYDLAAEHLGDLLDSHGQTWAAYVQAMGTPCNLKSVGNGPSAYSPDDEPFVQFSDVIGDPGRCMRSLRDLGEFKTAVDHDALADFTWLAADNWWDGEGAWYENYDVSYSNAKQDEFLRATLQPLLHSRQWENSRSLLILTWDESGGWGWPDNRVPTILVGSPGLLRAGTVLQTHVNGYDLLRTVEHGLKVGNLGRFDRFAQPLNAIFADNDENDELAHELWPASQLATRGHHADTFGQVTTPASVYRGEPVELVLASGAVRHARVNFEPLGTVPTIDSVAYVVGDDRTVRIPTANLRPGVYGAWLRHGEKTRLTHRRWWKSSRPPF